jgi:hypothetical protein
MNSTTRGIVAGTVGFFAGAVSTQIVTWQTLAKAGLAVGVCIVVSAILLFVLPRKKIDQAK